MGKPNVNINVGGAANGTQTYKTVVLKPNIPFAQQLGSEDTIYVIKWDFDLGGEEVSIPANCVLKFEGGNFKNGIIILGSNNIIEGNNTTLIVPEHTPIIKANEKQNIVIRNLQIDCTHNLHKNYEYGGIFIKTCTGVTIDSCTFIGKEDGSAGYIGLCIFKSDNIIVQNNKFKYFYVPGFWSDQNRTAWATYFVSLKNVIIRNNEFYKTYSGIKFTGFIENIQVISNYSEGSITDGFDFAGISALNVDISNNTFVNNEDNGIEFKLLEIANGHYDELESYYGYDIDTPRYFKNITICNNSLFGHRGIKVYNHFTNRQITTSDEAPFIISDDNVGNIVIDNNKQVLVKSVNPNSSYGFQMSLAANKKGDCVISNNVFDGQEHGINLISCCNIILKDNNVKANNRSLYIRSDSNRIDSNNNYFYQNQFSTTNGYCLTLTAGYNNIFENNIFTKYRFNNNPLKELPENDTTVFINNRFGVLYNSADRRYVDDTNHFVDTLAAGSTFERENGAAVGFMYFNTGTGIPNILKEEGTPTEIRYRITNLPTQTGYIDFGWVVDTGEKIDGANPSVRIVIDNIPKSEEDFVHMIAEQFNHPRWYMSVYKPSTFSLRFISKKGYVYHTPPAPAYETNTGATFAGSYSNGIADTWVDATGTEV